MSAQIKLFPFRHGNPHDPNVEIVNSVMEARGTPLSDAAARTFTRRFQEARERIRCDEERTALNAFLAVVQQRSSCSRDQALRAFDDAVKELS